MGEGPSRADFLGVGDDLLGRGLIAAYDVETELLAYGCKGGGDG